MCTFDFKGDSSVEAANSDLKTGSLSVYTSMKTHTSAGTKLKIVKKEKHN